MSEENVEIVRRAYERLNEGDVDGVIELCDEDFVMDMSGRVFNPEIYEGHDGIRRFHLDVVECWETYRWEIEETHVAGDAVAALLHCTGRNREDGPKVDWRVAWLWTFREDRPVSVRFFREGADALEAASISD